MRFLAALLCLLNFTSIWATDWPQLQRDAARTGRTPDTVSPPFRARWIWLGPALTLRNRESVTGGPDDLTTRDGYSYPIPPTVPLTLAESVQPVVSGGRLFVGTQEGDVYAISTHDGSTLWSGQLPGGTIVAAAVESGVVAFASVTGIVRAWQADTGILLWSYDSRKSITGAPLAKDGNFFVADHGGYVTALRATNGQVIWRTRVSAPVHGGLAADDATLYVGSEDMRVHALRLNDGALRAQNRVRGQSFRMLWPVVHGNFVWVSSVQTPVIGSEYIMESLMADSPSVAVEETNIARWLAGDTNNGRWPDAGEDWRHLFALRRSDLGESFTVLAGPADGCGIPAMPPAVTNDGRLLTYFKTRHPTFTTVGAFGTNYSIDICAVNPTNGRRQQINNGQLAGMWMWETDNLYALTVAGPWLWLRQNFRGTQVVNLLTSSHRYVQAQIRYYDGGMFFCDVVYRNVPPPIETAEVPIRGRAGVVVVDQLAFFTETFGVTALEHEP
ncbi:MAG: hypothetical protein D6691_11075 [Candidatus Hydrogenedentota bacterium]|uniref:Putative cell surface protein/ lipoprotein n=1 Tax=Sumerlaea chitinivorans TaxID=2250252 RepID=A0A2Z4Y6S3_SUMC1|nr:putative cell surface protein/ lipoprotein [Candidatus Sumerlaea chitinivorans]MCX7964528.1 PQQ-binding-like beta-propeller repeat protein [Candidatus Sumerlaea chitinivorans]RMH24758.1 MAG: hypothetical protein D6691_11075 [Candidatus Hydrogenedentota bacterium]